MKMKQVGLAGGFVMVVGLLAGLALAKAGAVVGPDPSAEREVTLAVDGMDCAACPITVRTSLERLDGVEVVGVDVASGTMDVAVSDGSVTDDQLLNAVTNAGYHATIGGTSSLAPAAGTEPAAKLNPSSSPVSADLVQAMARLMP
ncbi:MAG: heavy-metal-associated domain-containing protein [Dehalococcoidia bacterium]